ncbi:MAG: SDR family NAD(P)-dependent oxidoreductase [Gammaproteobacteria bacterium]|jgi:NAD(P)-dependent dehydrogenase (short-subunit alcohol dehydrogenase family)|nr:SDR family NAD(P)-dependent oxidoreductase [Gammaproteobacteria bacterium]
MNFVKVLVAFCATLVAPLSYAGSHVDGAMPTVLITGANRGIGFEFVKQYAELGWNVIATCRNPAGADELNAVAVANDNVVVERLDLLDHAGIDALAEQYSGQSVDVLLNNAGLMRGPDRGQMVGTIDYDEFDRFYKINAAGPLKVSEAFYPNVKAGDLKIMAALTTGTGNKGIPVPGFSLYKTSKAALDAIQKEIAIRWKRQGIKVVTLLPGRVLTHGEEDSPGINAVDVEDSVSGMIDVLDVLTIEQTGQTIQWDGELIE